MSESQRWQIWDSQKPLYEGREGEFSGLVGIFLAEGKTILLPFYLLDKYKESGFILHPDGSTIRPSLKAMRRIKWFIANEDIFADGVEDPWQEYVNQRQKRFQEMIDEYANLKPPINGEVCEFTHSRIFIGKYICPVYRSSDGTLYARLKVRRESEWKVYYLAIGEEEKGKIEPYEPEVFR